MIPEEQALVQRLAKEPFVLLGVNTDVDKDDYRRQIAERGITWRSSWQGSTSGPWCKAWGITSYPTLYLLDAQGVIRYVNPRGPELSRAIDKLLAELKAGSGGAAESDKAEVK